MKILLYGINFAPELIGIGKYTGELAARLAARGHEVRVVTAPPSYPAWEITAGYSGKAYRTEQWQGASVVRCPLWVPRKPGGLKRLVYLASFALSSLPVMLRQVLWRPQVVWVVEPALFCAPTACAVGRLSGAKVWLHIQDYEVDAAFGLKLLKGEWLRRAVLSAERWLMGRFDVVSTISGRMLELAASKGVPPSKLKMFPNWVDIDLPSPDGVAAYRSALNVGPNTVVALYSGNMGEKQGLEILAEVARLCAANTALDILFVFGGSQGSGRTKLTSQCSGLPNVRFMDLQPAEKKADFLACADIHMLPQRADAADLVMPSKLTGMLASARPVVATAHQGTELATVVNICGLVVPPEDPVAMANAVLQLAADPELRERLGAAGFLHAQEHMETDTVLTKFEADLVALLSNA